MSQAERRPLGRAAVDGVEAGNGWDHRFGVGQRVPRRGECSDGGLQDVARILSGGWLPAVAGDFHRRWLCTTQSHPLSVALEEVLVGAAGAGAEVDLPGAHGDPSRFVYRPRAFTAAASS